MTNLIDDRKNLGMAIATYRQAADMTQTDLADAIGTVMQRISEYERGAKEPSATRIGKIARALSTTADALLNYKTGKNTTIMTQVEFWENGGANFGGVRYYPQKLDHSYFSSSVDIFTFEVALPGDLHVGQDQVGDPAIVTPDGTICPVVDYKGHPWVQVDGKRYPLAKI